MSQPLYLIAGATGATGRFTTSTLLNSGQRVRALVHKEDQRSESLKEQGAEIAVGDLLNLDQIRSALEGVTGAYFVYPFAPGLVEAAAFFAQAAIEAGVTSIVNMSQKPARLQLVGDSHNPYSSNFFFAEWLTYPMDGFNVKKGTIEFPFDDASHAPIAAEDQGRVIAALLQSPKGHAGKIYPLYGPEELNHDQIAEKLTRTLGRPFVYKPLSIPNFVARLEKSGMHPRLVQHLRVVAQDYKDGVFAGTNSVVEDLTGRKPLSVEQFAVANRSKFEV
ncbi:NmrA family protein [Acaromyces ingoldii]|uniref:NmrA family protein n=1 Tax=Acaromyces ingoldii TaxID=215250 RepID=A0A316YFC5_9BASI|nr:NmrA family protein [Acaromyces ingoldii]PWN86773.1 NmrA family protein [Acaromyces ingoldii]